MLQRKGPNKKFGDLGEDRAVLLLEKSGYKIIERNFRGKFGEIDIIAIDVDTLVFVEVKTRWSTKFGDPLEAVTPQKLYKIQKTAEYYSLIHPDLPKRLRVDVVALIMERDRMISSKIVKVGS